MAAVLASGPDAVLSHWSAAALWGIRPNGRSRIDVTVPHRSRSPSGRKRSALEERFAPFLREHRLPLPRFNDPISVDSRSYVVDCHWPGTNEVVELDGWEGHGTRSAFRDDRARDRGLRVAGYSVTRLTWNQLDDEPESIASDLLALGRRRQSA